ncbi:MAG: DUF2520 domain-containing protein [Chloroflexi bacterium]|nr:DUF2520 domain-containing protein [Chloroflexota bacterium]
MEHSGREVASGVGRGGGRVECRVGARGAAMGWARAPGDRRRLRVGVVGPGRLGSALVAALAGAGYATPSVAARRPERARALAEALPGIRARALGELAEEVDLVFLTVADGAIASVAGDVGLRSGQAVVHCSGALGLEVLLAGAREGAGVGGFHPLQTFPAGEEPARAAERFRGIACGVEGEGLLGETLEAIAVDLGATSVRPEGEDRAAYHATAVLASNDVVALMQAAASAVASARARADRSGRAGRRRDRAPPPRRARGRPRAAGAVPPPRGGVARARPAARYGNRRGAAPRARGRRASLSRRYVSPPGAAPPSTRRSASPRRWTSSGSCVRR